MHSGHSSNAPYLWRTVKDSFAELEKQIELDHEQVEIEDLQEIRAAVEKVVLRKRSIISIPNEKSATQPSAPPGADSGSRLHTRKDKVKPSNANTPYTLEESQAIAAAHAQMQQQHSSREEIVAELASRLGRSANAIELRLSLLDRQRVRSKRTIGIVTDRQITSESASSSDQIPAQKSPSLQTKKARTTVEVERRPGEYTPEEHRVVAAAHAQAVANGVPFAQAAVSVAKKLGRTVGAILTKLRRINRRALLGTSSPSSAPALRQEDTAAGGGGQQQRSSSKVSKARQLELAALCAVPENIYHGQLRAKLSRSLTRRWHVSSVALQKAVTTQLRKSSPTSQAAPANNTSTTQASVPAKFVTHVGAALPGAPAIDDTLLPELQLHPAAPYVEMTEDPIWTTGLTDSGNKNGNGGVEWP